MAVTPAVFPLPHEYEAAKERKVASVADLRNAVKTVRAALSISVAVRDVCSTHPCLDAVRNRLRRCQGHVWRHTVLNFLRVSHMSLCIIACISRMRAVIYAPLAGCVRSSMHAGPAGRRPQARAAVRDSGALQGVAAVVRQHAAGVRLGQVLAPILAAGRACCPTHAAVLQCACQRCPASCHLLTHCRRRTSHKCHPFQCRPLPLQDGT